MSPLARSLARSLDRSLEAGNQASERATWGSQCARNKARPTKKRERGYKEVTTCGNTMVPELYFCIVCKNEGGGKEVTDRRPFSEGKKTPKRENKPCFFCLLTSVPHCRGDECASNS